MSSSTMSSGSVWVDLLDLWEDLSPFHERPEWRRTPNRRRFAVRRFLCGRGWHWPIRWSEYAHPATYDPPKPPEPDFCCDFCGHIREPYRAWWWDVKRRWYEATGRL